VKTDPLGNPVDKNHPWNQTTIPRPQKRDFGGKYTWVMSPRWLDKRTGDHLAMDTGGGPIARLWATALAGLVDIGYIKSTGHSVKMYLPKTTSLPEVEFEWKVPKWSNAIERDRARTYFQVYAACAALHFMEKALAELHAGHTKPGQNSRFRRRRLAAASTKRCGACSRITWLSRMGRSPTITPILQLPGMRIRAIFTARRDPTRTRCRTLPSSRKTVRTNFKGSTSCARCVASTHVCPVACICIWGTARCWRRITLRCSVFNPKAVQL
jgi:hypothetical protein